MRHLNKLASGKRHENGLGNLFQFFFSFAPHQTLPTNPKGQRQACQKRVSFPKVFSFPFSFFCTYIFCLVLWLARSYPYRANGQMFPHFSNAKEFAKLLGRQKKRKEATQNVKEQHKVAKFMQKRIVPLSVRLSVCPCGHFIHLRVCQLIIFFFFLLYDNSGLKSGFFK